MKFRYYNREKDQDAVHRILREVGWLEKDKTHQEALDLFLKCGKAHIAELYGEAECLVNTSPGNLLYLDEELQFAGVMLVTTSRVARKQGIASRLAARAIADDAADGALICGLGMFEQGFYNRLGFGTGSYLHILAFDPAQLRVNVQARVPRRVTVDDWMRVHASRLARARGHGSLNFDSPEISRAEMIWTKDGFGLGYYDGPNGELSHHIWLSATGAHGPYTVQWMSYRTPEQFLELMALIRNMGDQVRLVKMHEPPGIQLQDMLVQPFRWRQLTDKSQYESYARATAYWQMRICDLPACLEQTHLRRDEVRLNLHLTDPIESYLDENVPWRGIAGDYVVTLGPSSSAEAGVDSTLPTLAASVGAFTRMWLGVLPATGLAITDELSGPRELLERLDWLLRLPEPNPDWEL